MCRHLLNAVNPTILEHHIPNLTESFHDFSAVTSHAGNPAVARRGVTVTPGSRTSKSTQTGAGGASGGNGYYTTFPQATNQTAPSGVTTGDYFDLLGCIRHFKS